MRNLLKGSRVLAGALALGGCGGDLSDGEIENAAADEIAQESRAGSASDRADIPFRVVAGFTPSSRVASTERRLVFTSASSFRAYFGQSAPGVDFSREWVAFYSAGVRRTGGYGASYTRIRPAGIGYTLKLTTRLESPGAGCIVTQALTLPTALVAFAIPRPRSAYARFFRDDTTRDCDTGPSCANVRCAAGTHCQLRPVQCVRAPCPPQPSCVPDAPVDPCATVRCAADTHCVANGRRATCEPDAGSCRTDADCLLNDNYCGGCACQALGRNERPVTCADPVMCFRQPCGGMVARCDAGSRRCRAVPAAPAGVACGRNTCAAGQVCCNASCGICTPPGGQCIQLFCSN